MSARAHGVAELAEAIWEGRTTAVAETRRLLDLIARADAAIGASAAVHPDGPL